MTDWWNELAVIALLGTDRRPGLDVDSMPGALSSAVSRLQGDPAAVVLEAAALSTAYRRGGVRPQHVSVGLERAPDEPRRRPTARAGALLAKALPGNPNLTRFWCETAAAAGLVAPDAELPDLLNRALVVPALRPAVAAVLGERGRWLARMRPEWEGLAPESEVNGQHWHFGNSKQRLAWLRAARAVDPVAGLAALTTTWSTEPAGRRAEFLALLSDGLNLADEDLLETALDDPALDVRRIAAELLAALPMSGYAERMRERAQSLIWSSQKPPGILNQLDPQAARDGITDHPPNRPLNAESRWRWWLEQIVAATPLSFWEEHFESPQLAVMAPFDVLVQPAVRAGWALAAVRQRNAEWAAAVLGTGTWLLVDQLLPLLDSADQAALIRNRLGALGAPGDLDLVVVCLSACPGPWAEPVAAEVVGWLANVLPQLSAFAPQVRLLLELIAYRFPLTDGGRTAAAIAAVADAIEDDLWRQRLIEVLRTISQRTRIVEELT